MGELSKNSLYVLYYDKGLTQSEIADKFEVSQALISKRMREYGIGPGKRTDLASAAARVPWATYRTRDDGYEVWRARDGYDMLTVYVHRLAAVAWHDLDLFSNRAIHHKNGIPWDNREANIEVLSDEEHKSLHAFNRTRDELGRFTRG